MRDSRRAWLGWVPWCVVVFGLFNTCAGHREAEDLGRLHDSGHRSITPSLVLRVVRAAGTDDGDINRYRAYANAVLGRPYQGYYVRPSALWSGDARSEYDAKDVSDPLVTPPVQPYAPLTPYRDFLVEYPPGFFLLALPPAWAGGDFTLYPLIFSLYMGLLLTAALFAGTRLLPLISPTQETAGALTRWAAAAALALGIIAVRRYDAAVALSLCVLAWGVVAKRPLWAGAALGLGTAAKGLPIFLVPVLLIYWLSRRRFKDAALAAAAASAVGLLVALPFVLTAGRSFFDAVSYHGQRPLQIESTAGALLIVGRLIAPGSATVTHTFGSANVIAAWEAPLRYLASILPSLAVIAVCLWTRRRLRAATLESEAGLLLVRALCATLVALITLGKVFSPQYVTWLLPLAVAVSLADDGRETRWLMLAAFALTQLVYPLCYRLGLAYSLHPLFGVAVLARNGVLIAWAWRLLRPRSRASVPRSPPVQQTSSA